MYNYPEARRRIMSIRSQTARFSYAPPPHPVVLMLAMLVALSYAGPGFLVYGKKCTIMTEGSSVESYGFSSAILSVLGALCNSAKTTHPMDYGILKGGGSKRGI